MHKSSLEVKKSHNMMKPRVEQIFKYGPDIKFKKQLSAMQERHWLVALYGVHNSSNMVDVTQLSAGEVTWVVNQTIGSMF